jgi:hypothetical protein
MQQVELNDKLYEEVRERAGTAGFSSVDAYVTDLLQQELDSPDDFQHLFTPERLAIIDKAAADIDNGNFFTREQVDAHLAELKAACHRENAH